MKTVVIVHIWTEITRLMNTMVKGGDKSLNCVGHVELEKNH